MATAAAAAAAATAARFCVEISSGGGHVDSVRMIIICIDGHSPASKEGAA